LYITTQNIQVSWCHNRVRLYFIHRGLSSNWTVFRILFSLVWYLVSYAKETSIYILVVILLVLATCSPVRSLHGLSNGRHNKIFTNIDEIGKEFCWQSNRTK